MSKKVLITFSEDLATAADILRKRRKLRSISEYVQCLVRDDGQKQEKNDEFHCVAIMSGYERDRFDAGILRQVRSGVPAYQQVPLSIEAHDEVTSFCELIGEEPFDWLVETLYKAIYARMESATQPELCFSTERSPMVKPTLPRYRQY